MRRCLSGRISRSVSQPPEYLAATELGIEVGRRHTSLGVVRGKAAARAEERRWVSLGREASRQRLRSPGRDREGAGDLVAPLGTELPVAIDGRCEFREAPRERFALVEAL